VWWCGGSCGASYSQRWQGIASLYSRHKKTAKLGAIAAVVGGVCGGSSYL